MSYIVLRQLIQNRAERRKFLNDMMKDFYHALWYGSSQMVIPEKFEGLADRVINGGTEEL